MYKSTFKVIEFLNRHFNSKQFSQPSVIFDDKHHKDAAVTFFFRKEDSTRWWQKTWKQTLALITTFGRISHTHTHTHTHTYIQLL